MKNLFFRFSCSFWLSFILLVSTTFSSATLARQQMIDAQGIPLISKLKAIKAVKNTVATVKAEMNQFRLQRITHKTLEILIDHVINVLAREGQADLAIELSNEWHSFHQMGILDVGDHMPLSPWLAHAYQRIEDRVPQTVIELTRLNDLELFNYTIPIVFDPKQVDRLEYKLHFIPFSGSVVYWMGWSACKSAVGGTDLGLCGFFAHAAELGTEEFVAPRLSDKTHRHFANH